MPCYHPLQAEFRILPSGKKELMFRSYGTERAIKAFESGVPHDFSNIVRLPCGRCMGCKLERARQWAMRCMHEASLYDKNCFLTLTYADNKLPSDRSVNRRHVQLFLKRLRRAYPKAVIRYFGCGEYGERLGRPHYHLCVFGFDFPDKLLHTISGGHKLYRSASLEALWGFGHCLIGDLTFGSAGYVARYCTKKVTGAMADDHYNGRTPEFACMSLKPGIGSGWYDKWKFDCYPSDFLVTRGVRCKPPRFYDKRLAVDDPELYERIRTQRRQGAEDDPDGTYQRLLDREQCRLARVRRLIRKMEISR